MNITTTTSLPDKLVIGMRAYPHESASKQDLAFDDFDEGDIDYWLSNTDPDRYIPIGDDHQSLTRGTTTTKNKNPPPPRAVGYLMKMQRASNGDFLCLGEVRDPQTISRVLSGELCEVSVAAELVDRERHPKDKAGYFRLREVSLLEKDKARQKGTFIIHGGNVINDWWNKCKDMDPISARDYHQYCCLVDRAVNLVSSSSSS